MNEKKKVYMYTRVSTAMQVDGYSLDAQKSRMRSFAEFNDYEIVGEYEDAGKSGKSVEGRPAFTQMIKDITAGKDDISYVLVFKLSRFGRNAADVLSTLQIMQDFDVNLICVEDGIDSSKDAGKLIISVLSAVAEIERENIKIQTMEGRIQKAREGKWNGGFAPYGYKLENGRLIVVEDEAEIIRIIFDKYVNTELGINGIAKYLQKHGYTKLIRHTGKTDLIAASFIKFVLHNPVYNGKIAFGRRKTEKVHGTRNEYKTVNQKDYLLVNGLHEAIVDDDTWVLAQAKLELNTRKYVRNADGRNGKNHLLTGILRCPECGAPMYHNISRKKKKTGGQYKEYSYYACKHRYGINGHKCSYNKQVSADLIEAAVNEVIIKLVRKPEFADIMKSRINSKVDTVELDKEITALETELKRIITLKSKLIEESDALDPEDKHFERIKNDLSDRIYKLYDKIDEIEESLNTARKKKIAINTAKLEADNIYKTLMYFDTLYNRMNEEEKRVLLSILIKEINIYNEKQPNGQWLKEIEFALPIIADEQLYMSLDNGNHVETVVLLSKQNK